MGKYWAYFKLSLQTILEYRGDMVIYTLNNGAMPLVGLLIWLAAASGGAKLAIAAPDLIVYFLLAAWVNIVVFSWGSWYVYEIIDKGDFYKYLIKPFSLAWGFAAENGAQQVLKTVVISAVILIIAVVLSRSYPLHLRVTPLSLLLFLPSLVMTGLIVFYIELCLGLTAFWVYDIDFLTNTYNMLNQLLSGRLIPLVFLPAGLASASTFMPFRYTLSFPIEVLLNKVGGYEELLGFMIQIIWLGATFVLYRLLYQQGAKNYQGFGG